MVLRMRYFGAIGETGGTDLELPALLEHCSSSYR
ncbi:hypothetical protein SPH9361_02921 [Sphingobium sp. CECT 9361]|nr:hypothetical protein SPH9361_02921 [Sphingobium sp. CECT 9361]